MSTEEKIEKIEKIDKSLRASEDGVTEVEEVERMPPNKQHFDELVNNPPAKVAVAESIEPVSKTSLMDEVRNLNQRVDGFTKIKTKDLVAQADEVVNQISTIKEKLQTPNLELKPATQMLLQNKLQHIDENLRVALSKAGVEYTPSEQLQNKSVNPIERFLGFLTNGQTQLAGLSNELETLGTKEITPANMLRIQMKVAYISQEIDFFTAVLNKALESTKTIMNVQV